MEYREIVSVTGIGGLYQLLSTKSDGAIVRNLADNTTKFISARLHNVTPLESIEIYTTGNNVRLHEVLDQMQKNDKSKPDAKKASNDEIKAYFKEVYPEMDEDRVYVSDMKKMLKWFELLQANNLLDFSTLNKAGAEEVGDAEGEAQVAETAKADSAEVVTLLEDEKPAKKSRAKKVAEPAEGGEEKPAKKTAARKKKEDKEGEEEEGEEKPAKKAAARKKKED